jgi:ferric-dicitrate binding protein FerR (iron transport regulator)
MPYPAALVSAAVFIGAVAQIAGAQSILPDHALQAPFGARVTIVNGRVTRLRDNQPWAVNEGDRIAVQQVLTTGPDGYARFELDDGSSFDLFANSRVVFRQNLGNKGDLLDVLSGRVRVHLHPAWNESIQRIYTHSAVITTDQPAALSLAVDEDSNVRIDVMSGTVKIQHALLPSSSPVIVHAVDAVLVPIKPSPTVSIVALCIATRYSP